MKSFYYKNVILSQFNLARQQSSASLLFNLLCQSWRRLCSLRSSEEKSFVIFSQWRAQPVFFFLTAILLFSAFPVTYSSVFGLWTTTWKKTLQHFLRFFLLFSLTRDTVKRKLRCPFTLWENTGLEQGSPTAFLQIIPSWTFWFQLQFDTAVCQVRCVSLGFEWKPTVDDPIDLRERG